MARAHDWTNRTSAPRARWLAVATLSLACGNTDGSDDGMNGDTSLGTDSDSGEESGDEGSEQGSDGDDGQLPKLDVGAPDAGGGEPCGGDLLFSYIWIADSSQGAISKIATRTLVEEGRYLVRADGLGNPSRTSVNLSGDVAVANRSGGLTKVFANADDCVESNGTQGIQTSTGANDVLAWGDEECIAWHTPMAYNTQRPVAWTAGNLDEETCERSGERVWTSGSQLNEAGTMEVLRVNGETGAIEDVVGIPEVFPGKGGIYGGAVDGDGNFWGSQSGLGGKLVRVDAVSLDYDVYDLPIDGYGMTVDHEGRPWICGKGVARFDPQTETFDTGVPEYSFGGCMGDGDELLWLGSGPGMRSVNLESVQLVETIDLGEPVKGISIDFDGYVWGVGARALRVDITDGTFEAYDDLTGPYTYSDMTGFALYGTAPG
jgi:hypothetical protein